MTQPEKSINQSAFIRSALNKKRTSAAELTSYVKGMSKDVRARWGFALGAVAVGVGLAASTMGAKAPTPVAATPKEQAIETTPPNIRSQSDWKAQSSADVAQLKKLAEEQSAVNRDLMAQLTALRQEIKTQKPSGGSSSASGAGAGSSSALDFTIPPPPEPPASLKAPSPTSSASLIPKSASDPAHQGATTTVILKSGGNSPIAPAAVLNPPAPVRSAARAFIPVADSSDAESEQQVQTELEINDKQGYLPAGSFAGATLLSGVEALTGGTAQSQPQPIVIRIDHNALLPNSASFQVKGCHVLASVWGDMSSERVYGRLATLTCVDQYNRLVLSEEVEGNLVDSDGKNGIRGILQDRQGAKLARSLLAGFASGMASAFGTAQTTTAATAFGSTTSISGDAAVRAAGFGGANAATQKLAEFYMKQAESTMPVIAVDAGRKVSVLFTRSKSLKFESTEPYKVKAKPTVKVARAVGE